MFTVDLIEKLILLGATAAVSGFLIPFVLKTIEHRRTQELKAREAALARERGIVADQVIFLNELTEALWTWRYTSIQVTYFGAEGDGDSFDEATTRYRKSIWGELNRVRVLASKARRLAGLKAYGETLAFYDKMVAIDREILAASRCVDTSEGKLLFLDANIDIQQNYSPEIDDLIESVAKELKLSI